MNDWASPLASEGREVSVDAVPWLVESCPYEGTPQLFDCTLVREGETIAVTSEIIGGEACGLSRDEAVADGTSFMRRFVPATLLTPGASYELDCGGNENSFYRTLRVRGDETPAASPELAGVDARYSRDDNGCCGHGDDIEVRVADSDAAFLREGGYLEVAYPNGQVFAYVEPEEDRFVIPATRGLVTITPISASGARGEAAEVDGGEIDGDLVYSACSVMARGAPAALYLVLPLLWICGHGARRRRSS